MTAQIINLRGSERAVNPPTLGNGAREALIEIGTELPNATAEDAARWADWLLAEFWSRGFKVVPLE